MNTGKRQFAWIEQFGQDLRYALRGIRRSPVFFATAALTLALGIGLTSGIVTLIYGLILRPLNAAEPERLLNVHVRTRGEDDRATYGTQYFVTWNEFNRMKSEAKTVEMAGLAEIRVSWKGFSDRSVGTLLSSCNLPYLLGAKPVLGRLFSSDECSHAGSAPVVILSHAFWQARFGADSNVVGRTMTLNRILFTVIGVMAPEASAPVLMQPDIWIPITMQGITAPERQFLREKNAAWVQLIARLRPGASIEAATAELAPLAQRAVHEHAPRRSAETTVVQAALLNFPNVMAGGRVAMVLLVSAGMMILLLGCANVANLLLARGLNRTREIAVRLAIGAGRGRLIRQLLTESLVLAAAAGFAGLAMARGFGHLLGEVARSVSATFGGSTEINLQLHPDPRMTLFALALAVATGLLAGLAPALQTRRVALTDSLHGGGTSTVNRKRAWLQAGLVAFQVAVCAVLLLSSLLLVRGLYSATKLDLGMARENVLVASFDFRQQQYSPERARSLLEALTEDIGGLPGITSVAASSMQPYRGLNVTLANTVEREARSLPPLGVLNHEVSETYLDTMSVPLRAGRMFTRTERENRASVALVSEDFVQTALNGANPLGQRITLGGPRGEDQMEIIGVTGAVRGLDVDDEPMGAIFYPLSGPRWMESNLVIKYLGESRGLMQRIGQLAGIRDAGLNVKLVRIEDNATSAMIASRLASGFAGALAILALILACSGIAGVVAFSVGRRRREVGIRMALGSSPGAAVFLMLKRGLSPVLAGMLVGGAISFAVARLMKAMLYGVAAADPLSFVGGAFLLFAIGVFAAWLPARGAAVVDPSSVLRSE